MQALFFTRSAGLKPAYQALGQARETSRRQLGGNEFDLLQIQLAGAEVRQRIHLEKLVAARLPDIR